LPFLGKIPAFLEGFYINPSRRGPAVPQNGVLAGYPGKGPKRPFFGDFAQKGQKWGILTPEGSGPVRGPGRGSPGNRGAPARGVDVKPPSRAPPGPGPRAPGSPFGHPGAQRPLGTPPGPSGAPPGGLGAPPGPPDAGVLHQPLAPGPRGSPGRPGRALRDPRVRNPSGGVGVPTPLIRKGGGGDRRGSPRVSPQGCLV